MDRRLPPSQRDRSDLASLLRQTDRLARSQAGPGFLGGRLATPQPVPSSEYADSLLDDDDGDDAEPTDTPIWEDSDRYRLAAADVTRGSFRHQLIHTDVVDAYEFNAMVNGVSMDPSRYSLDPTAGVVHVQLGGWEAAGELFRFLYAYTGGADIDDPPGTPVAVTVVGTRFAHSDWTSIAWPAGSQASDLFMLAQIARTSATNTCTDTRARQTAVGIVGGVDTAKIWIGTVTDPLTPLVAAGVHLGGVQEAGYGLLVLRPASPIEFDLERLTDSGSYAGGAGTLPGPTGDGSGVVGVGFAMAGIGGTSPSTWSAPYGFVNDAGTYSRVSFALTSQAEPGAVGPISAADNWRAFAIGLGLA